MLRDIRSDLVSNLGMYTYCNANATFPGQIVDTAHYESGLMFGFIAGDIVDGTFTPLIEESDAANMAGATVVPADRLIGTIAGAVMTVTASLGDPLPTIGVATSKRYVRVSIVASGITDGGDISILTTKMPELKPNEV